MGLCTLTKRTRLTRAHPHARVQRDIWVQLPAEDPKATDTTLCAKLRANVNGTRDAGFNFELFTLDVMEKLGFTAGVWCPSLFHDPSKDLKAYVYGDNFVLLGPLQTLLTAYEELSKYMWAKVEGILGPTAAVIAQGGGITGGAVGEAGTLCN